MFTNIDERCGPQRYHKTMNLCIQLAKIKTELFALKLSLSKAIVFYLLINGAVYVYECRRMSAKDAVHKGTTRH